MNDNANNELGHGNPLSASSAEVVDSKDIDNTLDEFSRMLSNYSCDDNSTDPMPASAVQTRLESLFRPPEQTDVTSHVSPAARPCNSVSDSTASAAKGNPSASTISADEEASIRWVVMIFSHLLLLFVVVDTQDGILTGTPSYLASLLEGYSPVWELRSSDQKPSLVISFVDESILC